ncbi:MAG TPA: peptidylprolyl isomerase [Polyangiaceae bacterium]|nr:peptidylprolyl isomerase [Polyangiaceae bacterium]
MSQLTFSVGSVGSVGLALTLSLSALCGCADLTAPGNGAPPPAPPEPVAEKPAEPAPTPAAAPTPPPAPELRIGASHVLIQYKGSLRAAPTVTRSKDEAKKLAADISAKAKKGQDFAALAKQYSDEPGAKDRAGSLGKFGKGQMVKPFEDAAFALKPGEVSGVVETDFGFHVIKRTE